MPETKVVQVTGRGHNINLAIDDAVPLEEVVHSLRSHLGGNGSLYSSGVISVNVGRRMLEKEQLTRIKELLEKESGVTVSSFWCPPEVLQRALSENVGFGVEVALGDTNGHAAPPPADQREVLHNDPAFLAKEKTAPIKDLPGPAANDAGPEPDAPPTPPADETAESTPGPERGGPALLIKTSCRSGEVITHPGDIVVVADVNPGAELIADGDIIVLGRLRGFAHAGASGNLKAVIVATRLDAHRLQIGPHTGVEPAGQPQSKSQPSGPRIAFLRRQSVFVAPFNGRFDGHAGGTLYDG